MRCVGWKRSTDPSARSGNRCAALGNRRGAPSAPFRDSGAMQSDLVSAVKGRRAEIRTRWEALLRVERVHTPLAHPDTLIHLIDGTIDEVLKRLVQRLGQKGVSRPASYDAIRHSCVCGRNPLLAYFRAGEQALLEAVVLAQSETPCIDPAERSLAVAETFFVIRRLAQSEIESFCAVCQYRQTTAPTEACPREISAVG